MTEKRNLSKTLVHKEGSRTKVIISEEDFRENDFQYYDVSTNMAFDKMYWEIDGQKKESL